MFDASYEKIKKDLIALSKIQKTTTRGSEVLDAKIVEKLKNKEDLTHLEKIRVSQILTDTSDSTKEEAYILENAPMELELYNFSYSPKY